MRKYLAVVLMIVVLAISGCTGGDGGSGGKNPDSSHTGTKALSIAFTPNQPPSRIVLQDNSNQPITVGLEISNIGAEDITGGILVYSGFDPRIISWSQQASIPPMLGKSFSNPQGSKEIVEVPGTINAQLLGDVYRPVFQVTACYNYKTSAQLPICIDPDPTGKFPKPCTAQNVNGGSGQGAPISISDVSQEPSPGSTLFKITIKNSGGGDVFNSGINSCSPSSGGINYKDLNRVHFISATIGNQPLTCKGIDAQSNIPLTNGQGLIFCTYTSPKGPSFQTTLNVNLDYQYRTTASKNIEIVKLG